LAIMRPDQRGKCACFSTVSNLTRTAPILRRHPKGRLIGAGPGNSGAIRRRNSVGARGDNLPRLSAACIKNPDAGTRIAWRIVAVDRSAYQKPGPVVEPRDPAYPDSAGRVQGAAGTIAHATQEDRTSQSREGEVSAVR